MAQTKRSKQSESSSNLPWLIGAGLLGLGLVVAVFSRPAQAAPGITDGGGASNGGSSSGGSSSSRGSGSGSRGSGSSGGGSSGGGSSSSVPPPTLEEIGAELRQLTLNTGPAACDMSWRSNTSRSLLSQQQYVVSFFKPAVDRAKSQGASSTDAITAKVAALIVPQCQWPPQLLEGIDIDKGVSGQLSGLAAGSWPIVTQYGNVKFYLAVREIVVAITR